jgi:hypothetical protein
MVYDITNAETFKNLDKYGLYPPPPLPLPLQGRAADVFPKYGVVVVVVVVAGGGGGGAAIADGSMK